MPEENIKEEKEKIGKLKRTGRFAKRHPLMAASAVGLAGLVGYYIAGRTPYTTVAAAEVMDERIIENTGKEGSKSHYVLDLKVKEEIEGKRDVFYTLNVVESPKMPLDVLNELINPGSEIVLPYLEPQVLGGQPKPRYDITRFGSIESAEVKIVRPWETSARVMSKYQNEIDKQRRMEAINRRAEMITYAKAQRF